MQRVKSAWDLCREPVWIALPATVATLSLGHPAGPCPSLCKGSSGISASPGAGCAIKMPVETKHDMETM